jgi:hypothetical protein
MNKIKNVFLFGILMVVILFLSGCTTVQNDVSNNGENDDSINQQNEIIDTPTFDPTKPIVPPNNAVKKETGENDSKNNGDKTDDNNADDSDFNDDPNIDEINNLDDTKDSNSNNLVDCGDYELDINSKENPPNDCFLENVKKCSPAKLNLVIKTGGVDVNGAFEIVGMKDSKCLIKEISDASTRDCLYDLDSLKEMTGVYDMLLIKKDCN